MIKKTLAATAAVGGVLLAITPASAGEHDRSAADSLCAAPWQWNGPLSLLHESSTPGYVACHDDHAGRRSDLSVADDACLQPWRWNGPLEIFTVGPSPFHAACAG
ncbi:hypothetical protein BBK82_17880 [Lentzea guizhouensis]|uniref:Ricin B lectin domain-containing protein n=2 Tax=Lentzea guizhouensis TaxID=1586287 RepID=A0A1B2HYQ7_9PSEU|nr:hypothetical protein BBK82_17880 [Lentzea guizhouensis]